MADTNSIYSSSNFYFVENPLLKDKVQTEN